MAEVETLPPERMKTATAKVQEILSEANGHQQAASPAPEPAASQTEKRTRISVAKLLQRYQDRADETAKNIAEIESIISGYQQKLSEQRFKLEMWREAIAEINTD